MKHDEWKVNNNEDDCMGTYEDNSDECGKCDEIITCKNIRLTDIIKNGKTNYISYICLFFLTGGIGFVLFYPLGLIATKIFKLDITTKDNYWWRGIGLFGLFMSVIISMCWILSFELLGVCIGCGYFLISYMLTFRWSNTVCEKIE